LCESGQTSVLPFICYCLLQNLAQEYNFVTRFDVLTAVLQTIQFFWGVTQH